MIGIQALHLGEALSFAAAAMPECQLASLDRGRSHGREAIAGHVET